MTETLKGAIKLIPGRRGGRYPHCNSVLIDSGDRAVIDPGSNRAELRRLHDEGVGAVILSHYHSDHLRDLKEFPGSEVWVHRVEKEAVEGWEGMSKLVWFPEEDHDPVWVQRKEREVGGWGWPVAGTFEHGHEFNIGAEKAVVVHAPGHTPGHSCLWFPEHKIVFSSDIDLTDFGPWYGNAASNIGDFVESINRIARLEPEITVTGHEAGVIRGDVTGRLASYAAVIEARHARIMAFLTEPRSLDQIVERGFIYGEYYNRDNSIHPLEWRMVRHHLAWGLKRGELETEDGMWSAPA